MSGPGNKVDRDGIAVTRTSRRREAIGAAILAAGALAAVAVSYGPAWLAASGSRAGAERSARVVPMTPAPERGERPGLPPQVVRQPVQARRVDPEVEAVKAAAAARGWSGLDGEGPVVPPPGEATDEEVRGPLSLRRLAAAALRAIDRGWLTIDPPGSPPRGMALFPAMGTQPLEAGIRVPEGYVLPPGYTRHYQVTDDGELLPPILKFSPDYEFLDEAGRPIPIPADGRVPPELAPPDLPIDWLEPPQNDAGRALP